MLSPGQVSDYQQHGFLVIPEVFSGAEVAALRQATESTAIRQEQARGGADDQAFHLLGLTSQHQIFLDLARDLRLTKRLESLLGADIQLQHSKLATKPMKAGQGAYAWHQDLAFFPHTNTSLAAVMVLLDDFGEDNGCMRMIPGSHRHGMREHRARSWFSGVLQPQPSWEAGVSLAAPAGSITIHHCLTIHGSPANRSGAQRRGIVFQYRADDAYQLADSVFDDTGMLVAGQRRGVVRCEPGSLMLPRFPARGSDGFGSTWNQQGRYAETFNANHPIVQPQEIDQ